jgi:hypothetical protein
LLRGWRGAKRIARVGEVLRDRQAEVRLIRRVPVYLDRLQAAVEAVGRAIKDERWARAGAVEFQGE